MKKIIAAFGVLVGLVAISLTGFYLYTKSHSPSTKTGYNDVLSASYSGPYKKGREVFGKLVPFGQVWRTGANWATTFTTKQEVRFKEQTLMAGKYSIWTVPRKDHWEVIVNEETGQWGIDPISKEANRDPEHDVIKVNVPVFRTEKVVEQFNIVFEGRDNEVEMVMIWDQTMVAVPIEIINQ